MRFNIKPASTLALSLILTAGLVLSGCNEPQKKADKPANDITTEDSKKSSEQDEAESTAPDTAPGDTEPSEQNAQPGGTSDAALEEYSTAEFNIGYPGDWELKENYMGTTAIFLSPQSDAQDLFRENLNITVEDLSANPVDLETYTESGKQMLSEVITNMDLISSKETSLGGYDAYKMVYTGDQGSYSLRWTQYWTIKGNRAYVITYTSQKDGNDQYADTTQKMFESFKLN